MCKTPDAKSGVFLEKNLIFRYFCVKIRARRLTKNTVFVVDSVQKPLFLAKSTGTRN